MRKLIFGKHNTYKTTLLEGILLQIVSVGRPFVLIDTTSEEGWKSILNRGLINFDKVIRVNDQCFTTDSLSTILEAQPRFLAIDLSPLMEKYLEGNISIERFYKVSSSILNSVANERKYLVATDELPLEFLENYLGQGDRILVIDTLDITKKIKGFEYIRMKEGSRKIYVTPYNSKVAAMDINKLLRYGKRFALGKIIEKASTMMEIKVKGNIKTFRKELEDRGFILIY